MFSLSGVLWLRLAWSILFGDASLSFYAPASCFSYQGGRAHRYLSCFLLLAYGPGSLYMRPHRDLAIRVVVHIGIYRVSFSWLMLPWLIRCAGIVFKLSGVLYLG